MPQKVRELARALARAGFVERPGKGSHRRFKHPGVGRTVTLSGKLGDDAKPYQVHDVIRALTEAADAPQGQ